MKNASIRLMVFVTALIMAFANASTAMAGYESYENDRAYTENEADQEYDGKVDDLYPSEDGADQGEIPDELIVAALDTQAGLTPVIMMDAEVISAPILDTTTVTFEPRRDEFVVVGDSVALYPQITITVTNASASNIRPTTPFTLQPMHNGELFGHPWSITLSEYSSNPDVLSISNGFLVFESRNVQLADSGEYTMRVYIGDVLLGESHPIVLHIAESAPPPVLDATTITFEPRRDEFVVVGDSVALYPHITITVTNAAASNIRPTTPFILQPMHNGELFGHPSP